MTIFEVLAKRKTLRALNINYLQGSVVPGAGVEPAHPFGHWCLRPTRLPIPPSGLLKSLRSGVRPCLDAVSLSGVEGPGLR